MNFGYRQTRLSSRGNSRSYLHLLPPLKKMCADQSIHVELISLVECQRLNRFFASLFLQNRLVSGSPTLHCIQESAVAAHAPQDDFLRGVNCWIDTLWLKRTVAGEIPFSGTASYQDVIAPLRCVRLSQSVIPQSVSAR